MEGQPGSAVVSSKVEGSVVKTEAEVKSATALKMAVAELAS